MLIDLTPTALNIGAAPKLGAYSEVVRDCTEHASARGGAPQGRPAEQPDRGLAHEARVEVVLAVVDHLVVDVVLRVLKDAVHVQVAEVSSCLRGAHPRACKIWSLVPNLLLCRSYQYLELVLKI